MKLKTEEKAALQARVKTLKDELLVLNAKNGEGTDQEKEENKAQIAIRESELESGEAKLSASDLSERNEVLEMALVEQRTKDAEAAVQAAVKRGAIAPKDEAAQKLWKEKLIADPSNMVLLAGMRGRPALEQGRIIVNGVKIVREDSLAVLNAFAAETDPNKRAALYATEIRKRLDEGDPLSLRAVNTPGTLVGTLVSQRTLELLQFDFPMLASISTDFSDQQARLNQTVESRIIGIPTVVDYDPATGWPDSDTVDVDVPVVLNKQQAVNIAYTDDLFLGTVRDLFNEHGEAQAYAIGKSLVDGYYALFTSANYTQPATVAAQIDFARSTLVAMGAALTKLGVPKGTRNRFALLNPDYFGVLQNDQGLVLRSAESDGAMIEEGVLPNVAGFRTIEAGNLPATANLAGFAGSRSSGVMTARLDGAYTQVLPGAAHGNVTVVTNPKIGLSMLQVQFVDHKLGKATQRLSFIWGVAKGQINAGKLLKSAN